MRYFIASLALMLPLGTAGVVTAAEDGEPTDEAVQPVQVEAGQIELAAAEEALQVKGEKGEKGEKGRRGKEGAKGRRGGREGHGPPKPEMLFKKFDKNGDDQLSRAEFMELSKAMREHHARRGQGQGKGKGKGKGKGPEGKGPRGERGGREFGSRDGKRPGPPPRGEGARAEGARGDGDRAFRRPPETLRNPSDRPGPPEGRRGKRGDGDRQGFEGRRGGGPEGRHMPDPGRIFERFDKNGDDQLSRDEFKQLAEAMREMRERFGNREGHGFDRDRPGPPRRGGPEKGDRRGPPRGDRTSLEAPAEDDSTA